MLNTSLKTWNRYIQFCTVHYPSAVRPPRALTVFYPTDWKSMILVQFYFPWLPSQAAGRLHYEYYSFFFGFVSFMLKEFCTVCLVFSYEGQGEDPTLLGQQKPHTYYKPEWLRLLVHSIIIASCVLLTFVAKSRIESLLHMHMDTRCGDNLQVINMH